MDYKLGPEYDADLEWANQHWEDCTISGPVSTESPLPDPPRRSTVVYPFDLFGDNLRRGQLCASTSGNADTHLGQRATKDDPLPVPASPDSREYPEDSDY